MAAAVIPAATQDVTSSHRSGEVPEEVLRAESSFWRSAIIGVLIGMPVCVVIWTGLVALAMTITGSNLDWGVMLIMSVIVGCFAGVFFGGWAGVTLAAEKLEEAENASHRH
jgi:uncharacterized membrane protein YcjF (UPF0283 family)